MLDFAPQSGEMWQMPFENYDGELIYLKEGTNIKLGNDELEIRFTPGHSPGSVCFYHEPGGFVIGGDVLFNGSIGRTICPVAISKLCLIVFKPSYSLYRMKQKFIPVMVR